MTRNTLLMSLLASTTLAGAASAQTEITMWYHGAGNEVESQLINGIIDDFNGSQSDSAVTIESFPPSSYNDSVIAAALAGNLPCIMDVDGPIMPNWAWSGYMQPLDIDESLIEDFLPGTKGMWDGERRAGPSAAWIPPAAPRTRCYKGPDARLRGRADRGGAARRSGHRPGVPRTVARS